MPIFNAEKEVLAIAQLVNKRDGACFSPTDQQSFELFAAYCGLALQNAQLYDQLKRDAARRQVALEMISYHTGAHPTEVDELAKRNADGYVVGECQPDDACLKNRAVQCSRRSSAVCHVRSAHNRGR
eukprot:TRINITY_DN11680_c0_g1_i7.p2 TRINITY_DN11680_c0_g1~~TRINITY_DN11680_c0_g1_i7.p2  ORF type:complete len:127 (+),score=10.15 TRINITY_DN11680_c0_g1_i7:225-605(+)